MQITKQMILDDPMGTCSAYRDWLYANPGEPTTPCDGVYCDLADRSATLNGALMAMTGQEYLPDNDTVIRDLWDFLWPHEREMMETNNHPFWQAWEEVTSE